MRPSHAPEPLLDNCDVRFPSSAGTHASYPVKVVALIVARISPKQYRQPSVPDFKATSLLSVENPWGAYGKGGLFKKDPSVPWLRSILGTGLLCMPITDGHHSPDKGTRESVLALPVASRWISPVRSCLRDEGAYPLVSLGRNDSLLYPLATWTRQYLSLEPPGNSHVFKVIVNRVPVRWRSS